LLRAYLGFAFFDITVLPLLQGDGIDEFDEIMVDRISPADALSLNAAGKPSPLKGTQLNSFGAFFSRAYRENDYLWGRLHGAERMIDIVASTLPAHQAIAPERLRGIKARAFAAILKVERAALTSIPDTIETIEDLIADMAPSMPSRGDPTLPDND
jgi:hypothetical protein